MDMIGAKNEIINCTSCNIRPSNHTIHKWWETPKDQYLCCKCYVEQGHSPAEWHPLCMETFNKIKPSSLIETIK